MKLGQTHLSLLENAFKLKENAFKLNENAFKLKKLLQRNPNKYIWITKNTLAYLSKFVSNIILSIPLGVIILSILLGVIIYCF